MLNLWLDPGLVSGWCNTLLESSFLPKHDTVDNDNDKWQWQMTTVKWNGCITAHWCFWWLGTGCADSHNSPMTEAKSKVLMVLSGQASAALLMRNMTTRGPRQLYFEAVQFLWNFSSRILSPFKKNVVFLYLKNSAQLNLSTLWPEMEYELNEYELNEYELNEYEL